MFAFETNTNSSMQGAGGGPNEEHVTGLLVRSTSTRWESGSILGVDPGRHLAAVIRIIEEHLPQASLQQTLACINSECIDTPEAALPGRQMCPALSYPIANEAQTSQHTLNLVPSPAKPVKLRRFLSTGPFASLELPHESAKANGAHIVRNLISTYLISHPHLDHVAGLVVNTAAFQGKSCPKRLAALPATVDAIRDHIFNDIIWPNLSDENGGVGLLTYMRLVEARSNDMGGGESGGYAKICYGLSVKCWSVSHGACMKRDIQIVSSSTDMEEVHLPHSSTSRESQLHASQLSPRPRRGSSRTCMRDKVCAYDSAAFFVRDDHTGKEVLIFGDVEPDALSLCPRTARVWGDAARKIVGHVLSGILIECSYDDSRPDETLYGHLSPRHLIFELQVLAAKVESLILENDSGSQDKRKRKRKVHDSSLKAHENPTSQPQIEISPYKSRRRTEEPNSESVNLPSSSPAHDTRITPVVLAGREAEAINRIEELDEAEPPKRSEALLPLNGLRIIIIHVKDTLRDGPEVGDTILTQLRQHEKAVQLGCNFTISKAGSSIWL